MVVIDPPASFCVHKPLHYSLETTCNCQSSFSRQRSNSAVEELFLQFDNIMAEGLSKGTHITGDAYKMSASSVQMPSSSRTKPKLGRGSTVTWFNQSFDQATLRSETKSSKRQQMRRQSSVSDFFHSLLSSSKSHIVGILSSKKDKRDRGVDTTAHAGESPEHVPAPETSNELNLIDKTKMSDNKEFRKNTCRRNRVDMFTVFQKSTGPGGDETSNVSSDHSSLHVDNLLVENTNGQKSNSREIKSPSSSERSKSQYDQLNRHTKVHRSSSSGPMSPSERWLNCTSSMSDADLSTSMIRPTNLQTQYTRKRQTSIEVIEDKVMAQRSVSSAPAGRPSYYGASDSLMVIDPTTLFKRTLVKSNSETLASESVDQLPLAKASSDGNCFRSVNDGSQSKVIARITNYLFLGSVEAAYSEPLLCKYNISSLIDMTNMPSTDVPLHKKTDCPCACVNKNHFRSKLNIGVDDIEWENLGQYYNEINAFINGSRKKGNRILIFSYMGQSRAAAATVQYLMSQYKIPFNDAYHIIKSRRPQTKINSGFVKALRRLEQTLGLNNDDGAAVKSRETLRRQRSEDFCAVSKNVHVTTDKNSALSFPYVVRGAWLEC